MGFEGMHGAQARHRVLRLVVHARVGLGAGCARARQGGYGAWHGGMRHWAMRGAQCKARGSVMLCVRLGQVTGMARKHGAWHKGMEHVGTRACEAHEATHWGDHVVHARATPRGKP